MADATEDRRAWFLAHAHLSQLTPGGFHVRVWHRGKKQPPVEATERTFDAALSRCYAEARP